MTELGRAAPQKESALRTLRVTLLVCLVCSFVVSAAAVWLQPLIRRHLEEARQARILEILERQPGLAALLGRIDADAIETHIVELSTGLEVTHVDPATYDQYAAAEDPATSVPIPRSRDLAGIDRLPLWAPVYLVRHEGRIQSLILPVHGAGYGGYIHGYLALEGDGNTIAGISFFEHSETPGIGSAIESAAWQDLWRGKQIRNEEGEVRIRVAARTSSADDDPSHRIDVISGATRTSKGVDGMIRFWTGDDGFGPYLRRFKQ